MCGFVLDDDNQHSLEKSEGCVFCVDLDGDCNVDRQTSESRDLKL